MKTNAGGQWLPMCHAGLPLLVAISGIWLMPAATADYAVPELQQALLKHDQHIPGIRNEDPLDLARKATLAASSTAEYEEFGKGQVQKGILHPLNTSRAVMFPRGLQKNLEAVHLLLDSHSDEPTEVALHVREAADTGDFSSKEDIAVAEATVPPGKESWVEFKLDSQTEAPYIWVWLPRTEGISWRLMEKGPLGSCRAYGGGSSGEWTVIKGQYYAFFTRPPIRIEADCRAANIANGITRIIDATPNMWASDPTQPMPQWVELSFDPPQHINATYLIFDTDMNTKFHTIPLVPQCVRDYELSYHDGANWTTLAAVKGNFQRRRVHRFDTVTASKLRLTVHATNGDRSARVFEIRAYEEL